MADSRGSSRTALVSPEALASIVHGPYLDKFFPEIYKSLVKLRNDVRKLYAEVDLDPRLVELVFVRASQLNRCTTCLSIHLPQARKLGVDQRKIDLLPAWRESRDVYTPQELAALDLCEALTLLPETGVNGGANNRAAIVACTTLAEEQVAVLEWSIIMINTFNRISIASGHPALEY